MNKPEDGSEEIREQFLELNEKLLKQSLTIGDLQKSCHESSQSFRPRLNIGLIATVLVSAALIAAILQYDIVQTVFNYFLGIRCIIPNNYLIWEATRPLSNCEFCSNVTRPIVLLNVTREGFAPYAYSSKPIIVKQAFLHWPAFQYFNFSFFRDLYGRIADSCRSVDEECQFLHFKSNFISLSDVFAMSESRISNKPGEKSWYVGWGNCHPQILEEMRRYYPKPHFLPEDCEIPAKDYVFMGYDAGATMHLDFINRLMWQAQLKGSKTWQLLPAPECETVCSNFSFLVEPGDAVLVDTRVWYHATTITPGEFSLSVQSEYG